MAEVKLNGLYKVTMTEYERGFGQRDMGTRFFDNEQDAKAFCDEYNRDLGSPWVIQTVSSALPIQR